MYKCILFAGLEFASSPVLQELTNNWVLPWNQTGLFTGLIHTGTQVGFAKVLVWMWVKFNLHFSHIPSMKRCTKNIFQPPMWCLTRSCSFSLRKTSSFSIAHPCHASSTTHIILRQSSKDITNTNYCNSAIKMWKSLFFQKQIEHTLI